MTDLENFYREATKRHLHPAVVGFDVEMVKEFISQYGHERALGYIQALNDVFTGLEKVLYKYKALDRNGIIHEPYKARSNLEKFVSHNEEILKICNDVVSYEPPPRKPIV